MPETTPPPWHAAATADVIARLETAETGLSAAEARRRHLDAGPNRLPRPPKRSLFVRFLLQFRNILIYVLLAATAVTLAMGHLADAAVIFGVVLINALIGVIQEGKAEKALDAIRDLLSPAAAVRRDGSLVTVPAEELVPGDVVVLQSGDKVPADLRLFAIRDLRIDEALLTGESVPAEKRTDPVATDAPVGDRAGMAFSGTLVTSGQGRGVVTAIGKDTEIGRINAMLQEVQTLTTPLLRQVDQLAAWLSTAVVLLAAATFGFGILLRDYTAGEMFLAAVGLAVAAIPEGLPAIMTITLAFGVRHMARRQAIIRRLPAVETLGSVGVICSDKTGTLTRNEMTVKTVITINGMFDVGGSGYRPQGGFSRAGTDIEPHDFPQLTAITRASLLCNDAALTQENDDWRLTGDPTEGALLTLGMKAGFNPTREEERQPRTDVIPFESSHKYMATLHHDHAGGAVIYLKGAPERVLEMCSWQRDEGDDLPLDRGFWHEQLDLAAGRGQRLLAVAVRTADPELRELTPAMVDGGMSLLGIVGIIDPPREEAIAAVRRCRQAGITVKMITGDHAVTAAAIGREMGIGDGRRVLTGPELTTMDAAELATAAAETDIFARTSPEHKLRLVQALQAAGRVVAMTGDGVNDAPALRRADVGIAMGRKGTEVSKEAAEMVLADDNFATIADAVEEGRTVYDNLKKAFIFVLPTNGGEALSIVAAILLGRMMPITPLQILWVNMITAVTLALTLAFEPAERLVMERPPRDPHEPLLTPFLVWRVFFVSLILVAGTFGLFLWYRTRGADIDTARTVAVNTLVFFEIFYLFNTRHFTDSVLNREGLTGNPYTLMASVLLIGFQLLFTYAPPLQRIFATVPLTAGDWLTILGVTLSVFVFVEMEKAVLRWWSIGT